MISVISEHQIEDYHRDGFVVLRSFLPSDEMTLVFDDVQAVFRHSLLALGYRDPSAGDAPVTTEDLVRLFNDHEARYIGCMRALQNLPSMQRVGTMPSILVALRDLGLRAPAYSTFPHIMLHHRDTAKNDGYWRLPAHQDWRSIQGSLNCVVAWTPLVDLTAELGPLEVIPGSHRQGLLPTTDDEWFMHVQPEEARDEDFAPVAMRRGDLLLFSAFLVHRSGTNTSDRHRFSLQFRYNDLLERTFVDRDYPNPYRVNPQRALITPGFPTAEDLAIVHATDRMRPPLLPRT